MSATTTDRFSLPPRRWQFLPVVAAAMAGVYIGLAPHFGQVVWSAPEALTLSEAVVLRDVTEVRRLIAAHADPDATYRLRHGLRRDVPLMVTPIEAALLERNATMVSLLLEQGATMTPAMAPYAWCLEAPEPHRDLARRIEREHPGVVDTDCAVTVFQR